MLMKRAAKKEAEPREESEQLQINSRKGAAFHRAPVPKRGKEMMGGGGRMELGRGR